MWLFFLGVCLGFNICFFMLYFIGKRNKNKINNEVDNKLKNYFDKNPNKYMQEQLKLLLAKEENLKKLEKELMNKICEITK